MAGTGGGRPGISPTLLYTDAKAAVEQLTNAFGFTALAVYEGDDGKVVHAELAQGDGVVMLGSRGTGSAFDRAMTTSAFSRRSRSAASTGSGIGLDLARTIAESGGARLRLVSHVPTVFELVLPTHHKAPAPT